MKVIVLINFTPKSLSRLNYLALEITLKVSHKSSSVLYKLFQISYSNLIIIVIIIMFFLKKKKS